MSDNFESIISQDWDDIAIDDGLINEKYGSYMARLYPREGTPSSTIESKVDSISYSPEVNAAIPMTLDVEPRPELEGQDFLSGIVDVFVDGEPLFSGEIVRIETNEKTDDFYSIKATPPGEKLKEETVNKQADNDLLTDFVAETIDKYNEWDDEHSNLINTSQESYQYISTSDEQRKATSDSAYVEYTSVGPSASDIDVFYSKIFADGDITVEIETASSSYSETFTNLTDSIFGQWVSIEPDGSLANEQYDVTFYMDNDSSLFNWISLTESKVIRDVQSESEEPDLVDETVQSASDDSEFSSISESLPDNSPYEIYSNGVNLYQTNFVFDITNDQPEFSEIVGDEYSSGEAKSIGSSFHEGDSLVYNINSGYNITEANQVFLRSKYIPDYSERGSGQVSNGIATAFSENGDKTGDFEAIVDFFISLNSGESATVTISIYDENNFLITETSQTVSDQDSTFSLEVDFGTIDELRIEHTGDSQAEYDWTVQDTVVTHPGVEINLGNENIESFGDGGRFQPKYDLGWETHGSLTQINSGFSNLEITCTSASVDFSTREEDDYGDWIIDVISVGDENFNYEYSDEVVPAPENQASGEVGYLDGPGQYGNDSFNVPYFVFNEVVFGSVVTSSEISVSSFSDGGISQIGISFDGGSSYSGLTNTDLYSDDNSSITSSVKGRVKLEGWTPNDPLEQTPRRNYSSQRIYSYDLSVDTVSTDIIYSESFSGNRLKIITDIVDNSKYLYRWEGNQASIFRRGSRKTDVNLRKEDIDSIQDIEDVYSSVEVIGLDGITSGIIEAEEAPDYIDNHKEIRDPDIENTDDAKRRARSFLEKNSTIDFEGEITTLPTRAPVGEMVDGSLFAHGQDSIINKVRYGKRKSTIDCTRQKDLRKQVLNLDRGVESTSTRDTR